MDTAAMADSIRELGGRDFADPQDVHDTIAGVHEMVRAFQETLADMAERVAETGAHPAYAEAIQEAAGSMAGTADQLQSVTAGGVMRGPGG